MEKLLITGASGFLGYNLLQLIRRERVYSPIAHFNKHPIVFPSTKSFSLDLSDTKNIHKTIKDCQPDAIIHLAAISDINDCQTHPSESYTINVSAAKEIAQYAKQQNIPFVFTSTDLVFDGTKHLYTESDPANPIMVYGQHKKKAKDFILEIHPQACVCRMPLMIGPAPNENPGYLQHFIKNISSGKKQTLFTDEYRSVLWAEDAAKGLLQALSWPGGLYHLGGPERMNRYDIGMTIARELQLNETIISSGLQKDFSFPAPRPKDVSLNSSKANALGFQPLPIAYWLKQK